MKITVTGAAGGEVTGSAYLVETQQACVLVDCGLFQGGRELEAKNHLPIAFSSKLDAVLVTHGHLDHTGRLPLLAKRGYFGPVFATPATTELAALILRDSARLQAQEAESLNRKQQRAGEPLSEPLYTPQDAELAIQRFKPVPYQQLIAVAPGVRACWAEAGHILGSASIQLLVEEEGTQKRVVFSGDLGPRGAPILRDYEPFHQADLVFLESTYGSRDHRPFSETVAEFANVVGDAVNHGGRILVPTFAVGRAQVLEMLLSWMFRTKKVKPFPIFLDSPMAVEADKIYARHTELFDEEMLQYLHDRPMAADLKTMTVTSTAEESKSINEHPGPCLIMAGAGMCTGGRILHHLKHSLWKHGTHVLIVGYQSSGSLGRRLVDGDKEVSIFGEKIAVRAQVHTLGGFSAHAGQKDLLAWFDALAPSHPRVFLTHGEDESRRVLARLITERHALPPGLPCENDVITL